VANEITVIKERMLHWLSCLQLKNVQRVFFLFKLPNCCVLWRCSFTRFIIL